MSNFEHVLLGAVEAGGTKFVCALGEPGGRLYAEAAFATTTPEETLARVADGALLGAVLTGFFGFMGEETTNAKESFQYHSSSPSGTTG